MVILLVGIVMVLIIFPAIIGTLLSIGIFCILTGPLVILSILTILFLMLVFRSKKPYVKVPLRNRPKPIMVNFMKRRVPLKLAMYSALSSVIIAPILILTVIVFTPAIIAIPVMCLIIGVEAGRYMTKKK